MKKNLILTICLFATTLMTQAKGFSSEWQDEVSFNITADDNPLITAEYNKHYVVRKWFHTGAGVGLGGNTDGVFAIPLYLSEKFLINIPSSKGVTPFFDFQIGMAFATYSEESDVKSFLRPNVGAEFSLKKGKAITVALGVTSIGSHGGDVGLKLGYKF